MIKAIIFDLGKVLFKTDWEGLERDFKTQFEFSPLVGNDKKAQEIGKRVEIGKENSEVFLLHKDPKCDVKKAIVFYKEVYLKNKIMNNDLLELIQRLSKKYEIYGFTDTIKEHYDANLESGLFQHFKKVFTSFNFGKKKSEEGAFKLLLKEIKFKPEECIFIDDNEKNIEQATKEGFNAILYKEFPKTDNLIKKINEIINL